LYFRVRAQRPRCSQRIAITSWTKPWRAHKAALAPGKRQWLRYVALAGARDFQYDTMAVMKHHGPIVANRKHATDVGNGLAQAVQELVARGRFYDNKRLADAQVRSPNQSDVKVFVFDWRRGWRDHRRAVKNVTPHNRIIIGTGPESGLLRIGTLRPLRFGKMC